MLGSALAVDPEGGVELIRLILRKDHPGELFKEQLQFKSRDEFRAWLDEFKRKAAGAP